MYFDLVETSERIKNLREELGYSQIQLAEKLNFSRSYISKIEIGMREPSFDFLIAMSALSGHTLDYLITGKVTEIERIKKDIHSLIHSLEHLSQEL